MTNRKAVSRTAAQSVSRRVEDRTDGEASRHRDVPRDPWGLRSYSVPNGAWAGVALFGPPRNIVASALHRASCVRLGWSDR